VETAGIEYEVEDRMIGPGLPAFGRGTPADASQGIAEKLFAEVVAQLYRLSFNRNFLSSPRS
jgi:hypothetical protein